MNNTLNQVSGAIGTALLVTIMSIRTETHAKELAASAMATCDRATTAAALAEMKQQITMKAMLEGINDAFLVATFIAASCPCSCFLYQTSNTAEDSIEGKPAHEKIPTKLAEN